MPAVAAARKSLLQRLFPRAVNHFTGFFELVHEHLPAHGTMLDLGCGANTMFAHLRTPTREVWGTDCEVHPQQQHRSWFRRMDAGGAIPFGDDTFDLIASHMVMEHVADPGAFLREIARVLRPGGIYLGQTVHGMHYLTWVRRLLGVLPHAVVARLVHQLYGREEHDTFPTHYRLNDRRQIALPAVSADLEVVALRYYPSQGYFEQWPILEQAACVVDWTLSLLHPSLGCFYLSSVLRKPGRAETLRRAA